MNIKQVNLWQVGKQAVKEVGADDVSGLSAELAYRFFLALFPFFIFLAALGGIAAGLLNITNPAARLVGLISDQLPSDAASVLETQLRGVVESENPGLLSFGIITAIWAASSGFKAVMKAMNRAYDVEETRSFIKKNLVGVGLTLLAGGFVVGAFALVVVGQFLGGRAADTLGVGSVWGTLISYGRWPVAAALIIVAMALLYWAAPNMGLPFKWITPGAILFTVVWFIATVLFGLYVANFGSYNATYGALGGIVILLFWFYITAFIMLVGAEINAIVDEQAEPDAVRQKREEKRAETEERRQRTGGAHTRPTGVPPVSAQGATPTSAAAITVVAGEARRLGHRLLVESETKVTPIVASEDARITRNGKLVPLAAIHAGDWVMATLNQDGTVQTLDASAKLAVKAAPDRGARGRELARTVSFVMSLVGMAVQRLRGRGGTATPAHERQTRRRNGHPTILRRTPSH